MTFHEINAVIARCDFPGYEFRVRIDGRGAWYLQAHYLEADVNSGLPAVQFTRRWFLSPEMTESEIVQTAFKCVLTSAEHRTREHFRYRGRSVYGPHFDVAALWELAVRENLAHRDKEQ